jgi:hypothetical protein
MQHEWQLTWFRSIGPFRAWSCDETSGACFVAGGKPIDRPSSRFRDQSVIEIPLP